MRWRPSVLDAFAINTQSSQSKLAAGRKFTARRYNYATYFIFFHARRGDEHAFHSLLDYGFLTMP